MGKQPGVMFYFEIRPCLGRLTPEEKGVLFEAILDYGQFGREPELAGGPGVAWDFIRPKLDRDRERYEAMVEQRRQAAEKRWAGQRSLTEHAGASGGMPTTTTTSTSTSTSTPTSANNPPAAVQLCGKLHAAKAPEGQEGQLWGTPTDGEGPLAGPDRPLPGGGEDRTPPAPEDREADFNARRRKALAALADWARREGGTPP